MRIGFERRRCCILFDGYGYGHAWRSWGLQYNSLLSLFPGVLF